jgi:U6 snRNA-associated Sm-like protein LSm1
MENLTLEETPPQGTPGGAQIPLLGPGIPPPQNQQLPPQMFTTAAQLLDLTDSKDFFGFSAPQVLFGGFWRKSVPLLSPVSQTAHFQKKSPASIDIHFAKAQHGLIHHARKTHGRSPRRQETNRRPTKLGSVW